MQMSSSQHVLFIGYNKTSKKEIDTLDLMFDKYGMKYGWLGTRGVIVVENKVLDRDRYDGFLSFCKEKKLDDKKVAYLKEGIKQQGQKLLQNPKLNEIQPIKEGLQLINKLDAEKADDKLDNIGAMITGDAAKIKNQQYNNLITIFYNDSLKKFMEG